MVPRTCRSIPTPRPVISSSAKSSTSTRKRRFSAQEMANGRTTRTVPPSTDFKRRDRCAGEHAGLHSPAHRHVGSLRLREVQRGGKPAPPRSRSVSVPYWQPSLELRSESPPPSFHELTPRKWSSPNLRMPLTLGSACENNQSITSPANRWPTADRRTPGRSVNLRTSVTWGT